MQNWQRMAPLQHFDRTKEYWAGWALAHYQWQRGVPFKQMIELEKSHAQVGVVLELAKALNCTVEELL